MICFVTAENFELLTPAAPQLHLSDRHVLRHNGCHESPTELPKSDLGATTHGSVNVSCVNWNFWVCLTCLYI